MKFKHASDEKILELRKVSVKRMHRPSKVEKMERGRANLERFFARAGIYI